VLAEVMFSRPFADFDPGPDELVAGSAVREFIVAKVRRSIDAGVLAGDEIDIAHVLVALAKGSRRQENAGWLGTSTASVDRRWSLAIGDAGRTRALKPSLEARLGVDRDRLTVRIDADPTRGHAVGVVPSLKVPALNKAWH